MVGVMNAAQPKMEDEDDDLEICIDGVRVGSRVKSNGELGTVRYVGEIIGYGGDWIGVDWDNEERGKHNGCVERIQYFLTHKPKSGSFVRRAKLDLMQSCEVAIKQYYGVKEDTQTEAKRLAAINEFKKEIRAPFLEMVGFDKIQVKIGKFENLVEACIPDKNVSSAGDLANLCPHLKCLDVSKNLISDWNTVADIVRQLKHLRDINLSKNLISLPSRRECTNMRVYFDKLLKLNLSYCEYRWHEILKLAKIWPFVEELILAGNDLSTLEQPSPDVFMNLSVLRLDGNPIRSWSEIAKLGSLGTLKELSLNECQLDSVTLEEDEGDCKTDEFRNLEVLFLNRNQINNWRSVSDLDKLQKLKRLYFTKNPILESVDYDTGCQYVVARIGNLQEFNGAELSRELRRGAEYDYLKKHGLQYKMAQQDESLKAAFSKDHHRFQYLIEKHGLPEDSLLSDKQKPSLLSSKLLEITLKDEKSGEIIKNKFPPTTMVQRLTALAHRSFKPKNKPRCGFPSLYCLDPSRNNTEIHLDNLLKDLNFYSVANGDVVLVRWP